MARSTPSNWRVRFERRIAAIDALVVLWATFGAVIARFGTLQSENMTRTGVPDVILATVLASCWWAILGVWGSRDSRILGYGHEEYKRVVGCSLWLFGLIAIISYTFQIETARGYVAIALPAGVVGLVMARFLLRQTLQVERQIGKSLSRVLIIGGPRSVEHLARSLNLHPMAGYLPVATYLPGTPEGTAISSDIGLPTLGHSTDPGAIARTIESFKPDAVALSSGVQLPPTTIRALGWALADLDVRMIMAPALTDVAGPRIHTQPIAGLPLIHVSTPNLAPRQRLVKRIFDLLGASSLIVVLSPILLFLAIVVRVDSPGPVIFRQDRVGVNGSRFCMFKFRSMIPNAEQRLSDLRAKNQGNDVLFKMVDDPRVTRVGRFLRRFSLDELPQLFNVINGSMSLVGPRPPLPSEVAKYEPHVHRRLLVRPGLTGLWQVSGRSLLSWEDSVRLDLYYVENWSLAGDLLILLRTLRAVFRRTGAF